MTVNLSPDTLSGLAPLLRVRPELQYICRFGDQWASPHAAEPDAWAPFHVVTDGACVLHLTGPGRSIRLMAGGRGGWGGGGGGWGGGGGRGALCHTGGGGGGGAPPSCTSRRGGGQPIGGRPISGIQGRSIGGVGF
jgi:hypothetical protein